MDKRYKRELLTIRLPAYMIEWFMHQKESTGRLIEQAVRKEFRVPPPDEYDDD